MEKIFHKSLSFILYSLLFIVPFFFLSLTQEHFVTNKFYLLAFGALFLLLFSSFQLLTSKKLSWHSHPLDGSVILFLMAVALSIIVSSPNKVQALLNPSFGLVIMISLAVLYFYLSRLSVIASPSPRAKQSLHEIASSVISLPPRNDIVIKILSFSAFLLSILTIIFFFQPFKNTNVLTSFQFLKNPGFTPMGNRLDLAIFLGFFVVLGIASFPRRRESSDSGSPIRSGMTRSVILNSSLPAEALAKAGLLTFNLLALFLTVYSLIKPGTGLINQAPTLTLPPFRLSWYAAVETLKTPLTVFFGVGVDNFSSMFTAVKDIFYNQSSLWQINSFSISRSALLHIMTETGLFGLIAFGLLIFNVFRSTMKQWSNETMKPFISSFAYLLVCLFIFPTSLIIWFLFFVTLGVMNHAPTIDGAGFARKTPTDLTDLLPIYIGIVVITFGIIAVSGYFLGRSYASEYYFKKSLDGIVKNNLKEVYDNQKQAIILNPFIEKFRSNFAQINLIIANNLLQNKAKDITEQEKQTVIQAIQAGIAEAKAVVSLNPERADGWQNLASIYNNIINVTQGADSWTISAYQRAIALDPQNPVYRINLGGVYYSLAKYEEASRFFEQAVGLKPDWPNAYYNYAWASFQKEDYPQAVNAMEKALNLIDPKQNKEDYEKAKKDLEEFKKKLPEEKEATKSGEVKPGTLNLPSPPATKISPKIELPKESSPEAK